MEKRPIASTVMHVLPVNILVLLHFTSCTVQKIFRGVLVPIPELLFHGCPACLRNVKIHYIACNSRRAAEYCHPGDEVMHVAE